MKKNSTQPVETSPFHRCNHIPTQTHTCPGTRPFQVDMCIGLGLEVESSSQLLEDLGRMECKKEQDQSKTFLQWDIGRLYKITF